MDCITISKIRAAVALALYEQGIYCSSLHEKICKYIIDSLDEESIYNKLLSADWSGSVADGT